MAGEEWARRVIQKELGRTVTINDDGSAPGMYDLRIGPTDTPDVAIECVGAVDSARVETWNVGPARGPLSLAVRGNWIVEIAATARVKAVLQNLQRLLHELENRGVHNLNVDHWFGWSDTTLFDEFESLGIRHAFCCRMDGSGKVHLTMPGTGGVVDAHGSEVPTWLGEFLRDPVHEDVISKLKRSGAKASQAFVIAALGGVPWLVESYLTGDFDHIPSQPPDLPPPVTGAWVVSAFGQKGLYWNGAIWKTVAARGKDIDD